MKSAATISSFFPSSFQVPGARKIYLLAASKPAPFRITLVNLVDLEETLKNELTCHGLLSILSPEENSQFNSYTFPKRRREWLGGRLAAKWAVLQLLQIPFSTEMMKNLSILPNENGAPGIVSPVPFKGRPPVLSISHSDRFAVAMAAEAETCGIDIQKITEKTERVADRFSSGDERKLLRDGASHLGPQEQLTLLWSAKEALKKAMLHDQPVIFQGVVLHSIEGTGPFSLQLRYPGDRDRPASVAAAILDDCTLAYTLMVHPHA